MSKFDMARKLHTRVERIRTNYRTDMKSKEMRLRQRAVALYFIDKVVLFLFFIIFVLSFS
jgi:DNA topoisomerase-1